MLRFLDDEPSSAHQPIDETILRAPEFSTDEFRIYEFKVREEKAERESREKKENDHEHDGTSKGRVFVYLVGAKAFVPTSRSEPPGVCLLLTLAHWNNLRPMYAFVHQERAIA